MGLLKLLIMVLVSCSFRVESNNTANVTTVVGVNMLIMGDSVSRYIVDDWCRAKEGSLDDWTTVFHYKTGASASAVCRHAEKKDGVKRKDAMGFVHMYGSPATGPYLHGHSNNAVDPFTDTPLRICKAVEEYTSAVGRPTHITWAVMWWDLVAASEPEKKMAHEAMKPYSIRKEGFVRNLTTTWGHDVEARLDDIRRCAPESQIIIATTAHTEHGGNLMISYLERLRHIAEEQDLPLADFDKLVWDSPGGQNKDKFRDHEHPSVKQTTRCGALLMHLARNHHGESPP